MRLFIAIQLNQEMKDALLDAQDAMRRLGVRGNYTPEENLHLTAAFLGDFPDPGRVLDVIDEVRFEPFEIALGETGSFPRIWWAGIEESRELQALAKQLRRELAGAGIPYDRKKFSPHITLIRNPACRNELALEDVVRRCRKASMTVDHLSLMRSERGKHGMIYTEITE